MRDGKIDLLLEAMAHTHTHTLTHTQTDTHLQKCTACPTQSHTQSPEQMFQGCFWQGTQNNIIELAGGTFPSVPLEKYSSQRLWIHLLHPSSFRRHPVADKQPQLLTVKSLFS